MILYLRVLYLREIKKDDTVFESTVLEVYQK